MGNICLLQLKLLRRRKRFIQPALTANSSSLLSLMVVYIFFLHRPDHFVGHSLVACPFADNSFLHVYLKLLASLLPPSTRQPGPVAVLLGQTLKLSLIFHQSVTLFWSTEKRLAAASPEFSSAYLMTESLNYFFFFLLHRSHGNHQCDTDWQKARTIREKGGHIFFLDLKKINK